ncbi:MAG: 6-hydroxycyclohex-1-ene-1-carbonyl-CoA dehydrogenase [Acidobacteriota bacterium]
MSLKATAWQMVDPAAPLVRKSWQPAPPGAGEALIRVAGCGVCHTDVSFLFEGVRTRGRLPLTLGHEIAGSIAALGSECRTAAGRQLAEGDAVIVPAVLPCGECATCRAGRENICPRQKMPGNDLDGGFASHVLVPARFLIPVDRLPEGHALAHLAVVADAVSTPYQAIGRAAVRDGDRVVIIGAGGIGLFGVQIAAALGARVMALDTVGARVERARAHGAEAGVCTQGLSLSSARQAVRAAATEAGWDRDGWKILEMSGSAQGQMLAFSLMTRAGTLGIVGFTREKVEVRLSQLMALDADAFGSWGCSPRHYPALLDLIFSGRLVVRPFVAFQPLDQVNRVLEAARREGRDDRVVLVPHDPGTPSPPAGPPEREAREEDAG